MECVFLLQTIYNQCLLDTANQRTPVTQATRSNQTDNDVSAYPTVG